MKKVFVGILAFILCFCGNIVAQEEWMTIEKNVPELGISFSFPISDNSLYQQRIYVLYYSFSKYIQQSRRTCYNENGDEK